MKITFKYEEGSTYTVWCNGNRLDTCSINNVDRYTQGHICIAKLANTVSCPIGDIEVEYDATNINPENMIAVTEELKYRYDTEDLRTMASMVRELPMVGKYDLDRIIK
jgi:hypothetical protein